MREKKTGYNEENILISGCSIDWPQIQLDLAILLNWLSDSEKFSPTPKEEILSKLSILVYKAIIERIEAE